MYFLMFLSSPVSFSPPLLMYIYMYFHSSFSLSLRRESRVLHLRNNTLLAAAWKLSGTETLGDEFTFSQEQGIVQPKSEFPLTVHFRAVKPAPSNAGNKKAFKIEVILELSFLSLPLSSLSPLCFPLFSDI